MFRVRVNVMSGARACVGDRIDSGSSRVRSLPDPALSTAASALFVRMCNQNAQPQPACKRRLRVSLSIPGV